jgi:hypothetical protein
MMGEPRRIQTADAVYLVSNRTIEGLPFMEPDETVNGIIEDNLAWAAATRGIRLYGYCFLADAFFMLVGAPLLNLGNFMGDFQGLTARQINAHLGRRGRFFAGRYQCSHVLDDRAIIEQLGRILSAPCRDEEHEGAFKGVSSWKLHGSGEALTGKRTDRARMRDIRRANPDMALEDAEQAATTTYKVELAKLPMWNQEPHMDYHRTVLRQVRAHAAWKTDIKVVDLADYDPFAPIEEREQSVHRRQPRCLTTVPRLRRQFLESVKDKNYRYAVAAARLRRGRGTPVFPHGMIPPHKTLAVGGARGPTEQNGDTRIAA